MSKFFKAIPSSTFLWYLVMSLIYNKFKIKFSLIKLWHLCKGSILHLLTQKYPYLHRIRTSESPVRRQDHFPHQGTITFGMNLGNTRLKSRMEPNHCHGDHVKVEHPIIYHTACSSPCICRLLTTENHV